jgi:hypothetical protein
MQVNLCIVFIKLLFLLLLLFYCKYLSYTVPIFILMTSSISTLVDLWNAELINSFIHSFIHSSLKLIKENHIYV